MRNARTIQNALPLVARAVGRRMDVEIRVGGKSAETDGRVIYLPDLPFEDPNVEDLAFGYLEHEAAHVKYSEFVDKQEFMSVTHGQLTNILEDIRVERNLVREYPGFGATLNRMVGKLAESGEIIKAPDATASLAVKLQRYLRYRLRYEVLGQDALELYAQQAEEHFRQAVPPGVATRVGAVIGSVPTLRSTRDVMALAGDIVNIIEEELNPPEPPENGQGDSNGTPDGQDNQGGDGNGTPGISGEKATPEQIQGMRDLLNATEDQFDRDFGEELGDVLEDAAQESIDRSGMGAGIGQAESPITNLGDPTLMISKVRGETMALKMRMRSLVEASRKVNRSHASKGRNLDTRRFTNALMGESRLFKRKTQAKDVNTVVQVLIDRSGSMEGESIVVARESALAIALAMSGIPRMKVGVAAFPGYVGCVDILSGFDDRIQTTAGRYATVTASGGTPLLPALYWAADQLIGRKETRKILLVVTDGEPSEKNGCVETIRRCMAGGIETLGLGIGVPTIGELFPVSKSIQHIQELPASMFTLLSGALQQVA